MSACSLGQGRVPAAAAAAPAVNMSRGGLRPRSLSRHSQGHLVPADPARNFDARGLIQPEDLANRQRVATYFAAAITSY